MVLNITIYFMPTFKKITIQKHKSPLDFFAFCTQFSELNKFSLLGKGYFSHVYGNSKSQLVYKVGLIEKSYREDPYLIFLSQCDVSNPFFPKVRTITIFENEKHSFYVVEMEKLQFCDYYSLKTSSRELWCEFSTWFHKITYENADYLKSLQDFFKKFLPHYKNNKKISSLLNYLKKLFKNHTYDLHTGNMMMRSNGQLVIIDPICPNGDVSPLV